MESAEDKVRQVSRVGSRFALFMFFAAAILGLVLTTMSALQLRQVRSFSRQLLGMRARSAAMAFFIRYMRQPERSLEKIPRIVDEAALGTADYIQVIDADGTLLGAYQGQDAGTLEPLPAGELEKACARSFRRLDRNLPWRKDGTVKLGRGILGAMLIPSRVRLVEASGHPVMDALFALPGPESLKRRGVLRDLAAGKKGKGLVLSRDELHGRGAPCMLVRVGIDATAQRKAVITHLWILGLAVLTTLVILGINLALYRTLKQRERMAENLQRARRLQSLGEMAATLAHELKNPVGAIRGYAQLMREAREAGAISPDEPEADRVDRAVETIVRESQRLEDLVQRTLEFARPGDLKLARFDLREAADAASSLLATKAEEHGVSIVTDHDKDPVEVEADRDRIEQVIANLLDNAIEASPDGETVVIRASSSPEGASLSVRDRGRGIEPERLEEIFQPFTTTREKGTGLGLAVSRSIVEAHRGTIEARSSGPGAELLFTLPR